MKTLNQLMTEFSKYLSQYGDMPVYITMGEVTTPATFSAVVGATPNDITRGSEMNLCIITDEEAERLLQEDL